MCIILHHPKGVKLPDKETLERCFDKNKDGAGIGVVKGGRLRVRKGFMSKGELWSGYRNEKLKEEDEFAIHFRWGTSGGVSKENCHPFPLEEDVRLLKKLKYNAECAVMHNGIFGQGRGDLSDTMLFVKEELVLLKDYLMDERVRRFVEGRLGSSKLLIFQGGKFDRLGKWYEDTEKGLWYSNEGYKKVEPVVHQEGGVRRWEYGGNRQNWLGDYEWDGEKMGWVKKSGGKISYDKHVYVEPYATKCPKICPKCGKGREMMAEHKTRFEMLCLNCGVSYDFREGLKFLGYDEEIKEEFEKEKRMKDIKEGVCKFEVGDKVRFVNNEFNKKYWEVTMKKRGRKFDEVMEVKEITQWGRMFYLSFEGGEDSVVFWNRFEKVEEVVKGEVSEDVVEGEVVDITKEVLARDVVYCVKCNDLKGEFKIYDDTVNHYFCMKCESYI